MGRRHGARHTNARRARFVLAVVVVCVILLGWRGGGDSGDGLEIGNHEGSYNRELYDRDALYGKRRERVQGGDLGINTRTDLVNDPAADLLNDLAAELDNDAVADETYHSYHSIRHKSMEIVSSRNVPPAPQYTAEEAAAYFAKMRKYKAAGLDYLGGRTVRTSDLSKRTEPLPFGKIAFMFLTNKVMPTHGQWGFFFSDADDDDYNIYVNANPDVASKQKGIFADKVFKNSVPTEWGTFSVVKATITLIREALQHDMENERFVLVSDNTLPIASFQSVRCTLLAEPRSLINACDLTKHDREAKKTVGHDSLIRLPYDFPTWLNETVWRKSSQWFVLNRKHAAVVTTGSLSMKTRDEFSKKCISMTVRDKLARPNARSCYGDEHYFATVLALHGMDYETTCSEGVTYVNWETYESGHPKQFNSVSQFVHAREQRPRVELMSCGGRLDPPSGSWELDALETTSCQGGGSEESFGGEGRESEKRKGNVFLKDKNNVFGDYSLEVPKFGECLFARKFTDEALNDGTFTQHWGKTIGV